MTFNPSMKSILDGRNEALAMETETRANSLVAVEVLQISNRQADVPDQVP
jgi:hypothetical protein